MDCPGCINRLCAIRGLCQLHGACARSCSQLLHLHVLFRQLSLSGLSCCLSVVVFPPWVTLALAQQASKQQQLIHSCGASVWQSGCEGGGHCGAFTMLQSLSCYIYVCVCPVLLMFMFWGVLTQASSILEFVNQSGRLVARGEAIDFSTV